MSNVTIVEARDQLAALPSDVLTTKLDEFVAAGQFIGRYYGPTRGAIEESFEKNLTEERNATPRLP